MTDSEATSILSKRETCVMGEATETPCPHPATEPIPRHGSETPMLCAFHAATEPLYAEADDLSMGLEALRPYLEDLRQSGASPALVGALESVEADFSRRLELAEKVLDDLEASERLLFGR